MCMCNILQKGEAAAALAPHLPPSNHLHITSRGYTRLVFSLDSARGGEASVWDLAVLHTYTLVGVD